MSLITNFNSFSNLNNTKIPIVPTLCVSKKLLETKEYIDNSDKIALHAWLLSV